MRDVAGFFPRGFVKDLAKEHQRSGSIENFLKIHPTKPNRHVRMNLFGNSNRAPTNTHLCRWVLGLLGERTYILSESSCTESRYDHRGTSAGIRYLKANLKNIVTIRIGSDESALNVWNAYPRAFQICQSMSGKLGLCSTRAPLPDGRYPQAASEHRQEDSGDDTRYLAEEGQPTLWGWIVIVVGVGSGLAAGGRGTGLIAERRYWSGIGVLAVGCALNLICMGLVAWSCAASVAYAP